MDHCFYHQFDLLQFPFVIPKSNDIVPVRNQILSIDTANSTITGEVDAIESGSSQAGTSYTTSSSYS